MSEELSQVDLSLIADLVRIKEEEELLAERLVKMESRKEKVSTVVYQRVRRDYETRKASLEAESRPLKERARREYAKLQVLKAQAEKALEDASLEKEELEFRRELGEFPDEQCRDRLVGCEKRLAERKAELTAVEETKATFENAFHSVEELEHPFPPPPAPPPAPPPPVPSDAFPEATYKAPPAAPPFPPPMADSGSRGRAPAMAGAPARPLDVAGEERGGGFPPNVDATVLEPGTARPAAAAPASAVAEPPGATVVLAMPRLVVMTDEKPGTEHVLKAGITVLGRSPKSDIQIPFSEVSRKHAEIVWEADGYIILDLGSENGILVNGQRVKKHVLSDGDVVQIGPQKLVFRA